jgi:hypothetical protein
MPLAVKSPQQKDFLTRDFNLPHMTGLKVSDARDRNCSHVNVREIPLKRSYLNKDSRRFSAN